MPSPEILDPNKEHTLLIVKPDGYKRGLTGEILRRVEAKGYVLKAMRIKVASRKILEEHYAEHSGRPFFDSLVDYMSSAPVVAVVVEGDRVIEGVRSLMGATNPTLAAPGTIRGDLGREWNSGVVENLVHGSDSVASAVREIDLWFPELEYPAEG